MGTERKIVTPVTQIVQMMVRHALCQKSGSAKSMAKFRPYTKSPTCPKRFTAWVDMTARSIVGIPIIHATSRRLGNSMANGISK